MNQISNYFLYKDSKEDGNHKENINVTKEEGKKNRKGVYISLVVSSIVVLLVALYQKNDKTNSIVNNTVTNNTYLTTPPLKNGANQVENKIPDVTSVVDKEATNLDEGIGQVQKRSSKNDVSLTYQNKNEKLVPLQLTDYELEDIDQIFTIDGTNISFPQKKVNGKINILLPANCNFINVKLKNGEFRSKSI